MRGRIIRRRHWLPVFLGFVVLAACAHAASGDPSGAQGVVVDRSFENAEVGSLGGTRLSGENPEIAIQVVAGVSSSFGDGTKSLKYARKNPGGPSVALTLWDQESCAFRPIKNGHVRVSLDIMFQSLADIQANDPHGRPITGPLGDGIRLFGAPERFFYFMIGLGNDNRMGICFQTPVGVGWIDPSAVWAIRKGQWYRIAFELRNLHKGGKKTLGIPESFSVRVSTPEQTLVDLRDRTMPRSWIDYYDAREEAQAAFYDGLGVQRMYVTSELPGASFTLYLDNLKVEHFEDSVITISEPSPADGARVALLNPFLSADVAHSQGRDMTVVFSMRQEDGSWREIRSQQDVGSGRCRIRPEDVRTRNRSYAWRVTASDGKETAVKDYAFTVVDYIGEPSQKIARAECFKYGHVRRGREPGRFYVATQTGPDNAAAYDVNRGWSGPITVPAMGHPSWGYWDGQYQRFGIVGQKEFGVVSSDTFEGLAETDTVRHAKIIGRWENTNPTSNPEASPYTFSNDRAWITWIDDWDKATKMGNVKYMEWTKDSQEKGSGFGGTGWSDPVVIGRCLSQGQAGLLRVDRNTWYVYVGEGENVTPQGSNATLKYFRSVDAGRTWGELQDTGLPVNATCINPSFARYGDNYYIFVTDDTSVHAYYSTDGENWRKDSKLTLVDGYTGTVGTWSWPLKAHGTLLHQGALITTAFGPPGNSYEGDQYGYITPVPEMLAKPEMPSNSSPAEGETRRAGTSQITLSVDVAGPQTYDVAFYWENDVFIGVDQLLKSGDTARVKVQGLKAGTTCRWYAVSRGASFEYLGEPDSTSDEVRTKLHSFRIQE